MPDDTYEHFPGTSCSAPIIAGIAGLLYSYDSSYTREDIEEIICRSAQKVNNIDDIQPGDNGIFYDYSQQEEYGGWNEEMGYGRVNAFYALSPPDIPTTLQISGNEGDHPILSWNAPEAPDVEHYKIKRTMETFSSTVTHYFYTTNTTWEDTEILIDIDGDLTASYRVLAQDYSDQNSPYSNSVSTNYDGGIHKDIPKQEAGIPEEYALDEVYPNPFNPTITIPFNIPNDSYVEIIVFNVLGEKVTTLINQQIKAGYHSMVWNGKDTYGATVSSGIYLIKMSSPGFISSKKIVLLK